MAGHWAQLGEHDVATVRQLYGEAQNWSRHYEQLIVNANVLIVSACLIFVGLAQGEKATRLESLGLLAVPVAMGVVGVFMTKMLFNLYRHCIARMVRYERLLGCYDPARTAVVGEHEALLPLALADGHADMPASVRFFIGLHLLLVLSYLGMGMARW